MMERTTITVSYELKRRLAALKGERTWDEFLSELLDAALNSKIEEKLAFCRAKRSQLSFRIARGTSGWVSEVDTPTRKTEPW